MRLASIGHTPHCALGDELQGRIVHRRSSVRANAALLLALCCLLSTAHASDPTGELPEDHEGKGAALPEALHSKTLDDISSDGACKTVVKKDCGTTQPGNGRLARCARYALHHGKQPGFKNVACKMTIAAFFEKLMRTGANPFNKKLFPADPVKGFGDACRKDMQERCSAVAPMMRLACLKSSKAQLTEGCREKLTELQILQAPNIRLDPQLADACEEDSKALCAEAKPAQRIACLKAHLKDIKSQECSRQVFRREREDVEDIRFNVAVLQSCRADISKHCANWEFGEARMLKCLWEKMVGPKRFELNQACIMQVRNITERGVSDYRLDFRVRTRCEADIGQLCEQERKRVDSLSISDLMEVESSGEVLRCLKSHFTAIQAESCKEEMNRVVRVQSWHATADPVLKRECQDDIKRYCNNVLPQNMHLCLRQHVVRLSAGCKNAEILQTALESKDISLKPVMFSACKAAIGPFCPKVAAGNARLINCLQDRMGDSSFPPSCKKALQLDLTASNHDWHLKFGVSQECEPDINSFCPGEKQSGGGTVLSCLQRHLARIKGEGCKHEVQRFIKQGVDNIQVTPSTYSQCLADVKQFCDDVEPGSGRVHECLVKHRMQLSASCSAAEFRVQALAATDLTLNPKVAKDCQSSIAKLCTGLEPGHGRLWSCLEQHRGKEGMASECESHVEEHMKLKHSEFKLNPQLATLCKKDAERLCPEEMQKHDLKLPRFTDSHVITCLIEHREEIESKACQTSLRRKEEQRVEKASLDLEAHDVCISDVDRFCKPMKESGDPVSIQDCLQADPGRLSIQCRRKQKLYVRLAAQDVRLNSNLATCDTMRTTACKGVEEGRSKVLACLVDHMHDTSFDVRCRESLVQEQARWLRFSPVHPFVIGSCRNDFAKLDGRQNCSSASGGPQKDIVCLFSNMEELSQECKGAVAEHRKRISADLRAYRGMEEACHQDTKTLCAGVEPGAGRLHACLREHKERIVGATCLNMVEAVEREDRQHASINFHTRKDCASEILTFCGDVQPGSSRILSCLGMHQNRTRFSSECRKALLGTDVRDIVKARLKEKLVMSVDEIDRFLRMHQGFVSRNGGLLLGIAVGVTAVLSFCISYVCLKRKAAKTMYTVSYPDGPDNP